MILACSTSILIVSALYPHLIIYISTIPKTRWLLSLLRVYSVVLVPVFWKVYRIPPYFIDWSVGWFLCNDHLSREFAILFYLMVISYLGLRIWWTTLVWCFFFLLVSSVINFESSLPLISFISIPKMDNTRYYHVPASPLLYRFTCLDIIRLVVFALIIAFHIIFPISI